RRVAEDRVWKSVRREPPELPEHDREHDHRQERLENRPGDADRGLLVANRDVPPGEMPRELAEVPQLAHVEVRPARCRLDHRPPRAGWLALRDQRLVRDFADGNLRLRHAHDASGRGRRYPASSATREPRQPPHDTWPEACLELADTGLELADVPIER